jgi:hypothetical protein
MPPPSVARTPSRSVVSVPAWPADPKAASRRPVRPAPPTASGEEGCRRATNRSAARDHVRVPMREGAMR